MVTALRQSIGGVLVSGVIGVIMGAASVVPGLSAGTVAVVLGVYPELVENIGRLRMRRLLALGGGWVVGALVGVQTVGWGFQRVPAQTHAFLLGIVLASALNIVRRHPPSPAGISLIAAGLVAVWFLVPLAATEAVSVPVLSPLQLTGSGIASGSAMILPGFSGGTALVMLGVYSRVIGVAARWDWAGMLQFASGALAGVIVTGMLLWRVYRVRRELLYALLAGLTAGSARALLPDLFSPSVVAWAMFGFALALYLGHAHGEDSLERGNTCGDSDTS